jgi:hypothetical protein
MCLSENSLVGAKLGFGIAGGGGRIGSSLAEEAARKESSKEAVTRLVEVQTRRRRIMYCLCGWA